MRTARWQLEEDIKTLLEEGQLCRGLTDYMLDADGFFLELEAGRTVFLETFARSGGGTSLRSLYNVTARQLPVWSGSLELLTEDLEDMLHRGMSCIVLAGAEQKNAETLAADLQKKEIPALYAPSPQAPVKGRVLVVCGGLSAGFEFPEAGLAVVTHGRAASAARRKTRRSGKNKGAEIHSLSELTPGDYVVHAAHGIGLYQGIRQLDIQGVVKDYLQIQYDKGDTLYVPVTQLDLVSKYIGAKEETRVKLHRLGGQEWQKTKTRVRAAVKDIARELIALYAKRMQQQGYAFEPDGEWQYDFERHFEYEETDGPAPLCEGDQGGHGTARSRWTGCCAGTWASARPRWPCAPPSSASAESKQCVVLVPTTILAFQHYNTIVRRFEGFPVKVEMLSRFRTAKQQAETIQRVRRGEVDILVGTHRLLSKDVYFQDLGLMIVDEEQRFGVAQKERLKELAPNVDVLTLSATPIPRTLNMAMSGIRDMSVIEEAPMDRRPVQTYVLEHDNGILTDAMRRELRRGGQVLLSAQPGGNHRTVRGGHPDAPTRGTGGLRPRQDGRGAAVAISGGSCWSTRSIFWCAPPSSKPAWTFPTPTPLSSKTPIASACPSCISSGAGWDVPPAAPSPTSPLCGARYSPTLPPSGWRPSGNSRSSARASKSPCGTWRSAARAICWAPSSTGIWRQWDTRCTCVCLSEAVSEEKGEAGAGREAECLVDLQVSAHIPEDYITVNAQRLEVYRRIADIRSQEDSLDVYDELIDRFGEPPAGGHAVSSTWRCCATWRPDQGYL